uniref:Uncharacterized protein n=1 Tax=Romanomermis culicivorax TaxID=13658 RepID=A0A915L9L3_ROMCU
MRGGSATGMLTIAVSNGSFLPFCTKKIFTSSAMPLSLRAKILFSKQYLIFGDIIGNSKIVFSNRYNFVSKAKAKFKSIRAASPSDWRRIPFPGSFDRQKLSSSSQQIQMRFTILKYEIHQIRRKTYLDRPQSFPLQSISSQRPIHATDDDSFLNFRQTDGQRIELNDRFFGYSNTALDTKYVTVTTSN